MSAGKTDFDKFLANELKKYQGILVPVKASMSERMLVKKIDPAKLHPNPDDEFCDPSIGPNYGIISDYMKMIAQYRSLKPNSWDEPIIVEKVHPDGYIILNGHHRWAAAIRTGFKPVPVQIVNLTQETDIEEMIRNSNHDRRATLDLDEVVFCENESEPTEKPLPFPHSRQYKERIRKGIPALLHYLSVRGYDIWVYTKQYYSIDYIQRYFKKYSVKVDGVITGTARKSKNTAAATLRTRKLFSSQYKETLHIDRDMVLRTRRNSREFDEYTVDAGPEEWSLAVMKIIKKLDKEARMQ